MKKFTFTHLLGLALGLMIFILPLQEAKAQSKEPLNPAVLMKMSEDIDPPVVFEMNDTPDTPSEPIMIIQDRSVAPSAPLSSPMMETESVMAEANSSLKLLFVPTQTEKVERAKANIAELAGTK